MRIVQVDNFQHRRYGRTKVSTGRKIFYGFIRNNHQVQEFSDRDSAKFESLFNTHALGVARANKRLIETCENFRPDLLMLGHADIIKNTTIAGIRSRLPSIKVAFRNVDPPFDQKNVAKIERRMDVADAIFLTTGGEWLKQFVTAKNVVSFMPNPTDPAIEVMNNAERDDFDIDLVFCGVGNRTDPRYGLVGRLHEKLPDVRFRSFGMHGEAAVWGIAYDHVLEASKMGLNLNREEGHTLYSSARISQLMGNGLLTFMSTECGYKRFLSEDEAVFFDDEDSLVRQICAFQNDDARRKAVARAGRDFYHRHFSAKDVAQYIVETTFGVPYSKDYIWQDEVYRS